MYPVWHLCRGLPPPAGNPYGRSHVTASGALKGQQVIAQGVSPGLGQTHQRALKGRHIFAIVSPRKNLCVPTSPSPNERVVPNSLLHHIRHLPRHADLLLRRSFVPETVRDVLIPLYGMS